MITELKPYPEMKDSSVEWLGEVPEHWDISRLRIVASILNGATPSTSEEEYWNGKILWLTPEDLGVLNTRRISESARKITPEGHASCGTSLAQQNSVVISTRAPIGHLGILDSEGCTNQGCKLLVPSAHILEDYLYDVLKSARSELQSLGNGATFSELSKTNLGSFRLPVPSRPEQTAIVRFLSHATAHIDLYIRTKKKLITLLEEQKKVVIHQTVTGQIDVRTGQSYSSYKDSGVKWFGEVPAHWSIERLKSSVDNIVEQNAEREQNDIYLALEHVESWTGRIRDSNLDDPPDSQLKRFQPEDVLFGKLRPYLAKVTRLKVGGLCVGEFLVLRIRNSLICPNYLEYLLRSKLVIEAIDSSTFGARMPRADWKFIGCMEVPHPAFSEQTAIVRYLDKISFKIDETIVRTKREIELLREHSKRLISDVVTGKLDVREAATRLPQEADKPAFINDSDDFTDREKHVDTQPSIDEISL